MTSAVGGSLSGLWKFPVKSMRGEQLAEVEITRRGLVGDRAYGLIDAETGKVVSAKSLKLFSDMLRCHVLSASFPQDELAKDTDILRTLARHDRLQVGATGQFPCAGAYAVVAAPGTMRTGDRVALA